VFDHARVEHNHGQQLLGRHQTLHEQCNRQKYRWGHLVCRRSGQRQEFQQNHTTQHKRNDIRVLGTHGQNPQKSKGCHLWGQTIGGRWLQQHDVGFERLRMYSHWGKARGQAHDADCTLEREQVATLLRSAARRRCALALRHRRVWQEGKLAGLHRTSQANRQLRWL
jgi:hypothetical protein